MLEVVILAAGKGTRMRSETPKVLHTLAGIPFLFHVINTAKELSPDAIHLVVGHGSEMVIEAVKSHYADEEIKFNFVLQEQQLGTGHAVQQALPLLNNDSKTLVLYGDVPLIAKETLKSLVNKVVAQTMGLLTVEFADPTGYGRIVRDDSGKVSAIVEQKDASEEQLKIAEGNSGVMAFNTAHLAEWLPGLSNNNAQNEYYLTDLIEVANTNSITVETVIAEVEHEVYGVNNRRQQAELERIYQAEIAGSLLDQGVTLLDPSRFDCRGTVSVGTDCVIDVNCVFEGDVQLGNGVEIGPNCIIINSSIGDNCKICANSIIEDSSLESSCNIGPFARLRPKSDLRKGAKVGNFVETKKAVIGEGSKVNHLSYVGDAKVGEGVNIGAGTITCNYDGVNKSLTEIEDGVFVGSNTALVAPVKVGKDATIGAGSVVSTNVEEKQLAVARAKQRNIDGWKRPTKR